MFLGFWNACRKKNVRGGDFGVPHAPTRGSRGSENDTLLPMAMTCDRLKFWSGPAWRSKVIIRKPWRRKNKKKKKKKFWQNHKAFPAGSRECLIIIGYPRNILEIAVPHKWFRIHLQWENTSLQTFSWRTVFSPTTLLCDISNLLARYGIFSHLFVVSLDFLNIVASQINYVNVIE